MRYALRGVHEDQRAGGVGPFHDGFDGIDGAQHVRHVRDGHDARPLRDQFVRLVHVERPVIMDVEIPEHGTGLPRKHLPGHDVAVVLHDGQHDLVARPDVLPAPGAGHQVDALGGIAHEDQVPGRRVDESGHPLAGFFVGVGRLLAQRVESPVDVGVQPRIVIVQGVEHHPGFLRRGAVVQVDQRLAVHLPVQNGEIAAVTQGVFVGPSDRVVEPAWGFNQYVFHDSLPGCGKRMRSVVDTGSDQ